MIQRFQKHGLIGTVVFVFLSGVGILMAINQLFSLNMFGLTLLETSYFYVILAIYLSVVFLLFPAGRGSPRNSVPWYDILLFLMTLVVGFYFGVNGLDIIQRGWEYEAPTIPTIFSLLLCLLVLEAVRRTTDIYMLLTCLVISLYPLFAMYLPGFLQGQSYDLLTMARLYVMGRNGIIGIPIDVVCSLLLGFMVFGMVLQGTGGGSFFFKLAQSLLGHSRGGAAKISILASGFFGMISGSTTSNTLTIGSMTIPAMKKTGYPAHYAAAIEACASTGGPIMPPVMGAGAFIMAYFLNVPYSYVAIGALIPGCLYYLGLFVQVDCFAAKTGLQGLPKEDLPPFWKTLKEGWFYILDILLLVYLLLVLNWEGKAPYYASAFLILLCMIRKGTRLTAKQFVELIQDIGKVIAQLVAILAGAGLIIGGLSVTGVALAFSSELVGAVGNSTFLILLTGAFSSFVLGLGMTITACYVFLAIVMAPALVTLGIDPLAAHLFVFYWGVLSEITPPVALCVSVAAGLAGSNFMQTGWTAMKLGVIKYIIPFFFVYNPALLTHGSFSEVISSVTSAFIGVFYLGCGLERYLWGVGKMGMPACILLVVGGLMTAFPEKITTIGGLVLLILVHTIGYLKQRNKHRPG